MLLATGSLLCYVFKLILGPKELVHLSGQKSNEETMEMN